jgi:LmbE family N-acetylglucosaminyl deacetylase
MADFNLFTGCLAEHPPDTGDHTETGHAGRFIDQEYSICHRRYYTVRMQKVIFGIFAHPDDEAFGPAGTLLMEARQGAEIHLICATAGEAGSNPDDVDNLADVRLDEWRTAGKLIGAASMHHLGYRDGTLCNDNYFEIAAKIETIVHDVTDGRDDLEIEFMSIDLNGVTGHLDHIAVGRIACYVFCRAKQADARVTKLRLACIGEGEVPRANCDWLYMDRGRSASEIDETVDASAYLEDIKRIMHAHHTQRQDCEAHLKKMGDRVALNRFLVLT